MRALVGNPLRATPWLPAYHEELDYSTPPPPPPPPHPARRMLVVSRGTLSATAAAV
jgi:hypothetical protein